MGRLLREKVDRKQEELARLAEVAEADFLGSVGADRVAGQAPPHFEPPGTFNQGQDSREQARRDQDQLTPGQGRREDGNRLPSPMEAPLLASHPGSGERGGREQPQPAYLHRFPMLKRGRTKLEAERSGLDDVVEEAVWGGCNKRKAELIEKDLNKMEERLEKYAELYDEAVGVLPEEEREGASRDRDASYADFESCTRRARAKVWRHTQETPPRPTAPPEAIFRGCLSPTSPERRRSGRSSGGTSAN